MLDLGRMQEVPPQEQVLLESVETSEAYKTHPIEVQVQRYWHPRKQRTVVVVTLDVTDESVGEKSAIVARFAPLDATERTPCPRAMICSTRSATSPEPPGLGSTLPRRAGPRVSVSELEASVDRGTHRGFKLVALVDAISDINCD